MIPCLHHIARLQAFHRRGAEQTRTGQLRNAPILERRVVVVHELEMVDGDRLRRLLIGISVGTGLLAGRLTAGGRRDRQDRLVSAVIFHGHGRKRCRGKGKGENAGHHRHAEAAFQRSTRSRSKSKQRFHVKLFSISVGPGPTSLILLMSSILLDLQRNCTKNGIGIQSPIPRKSTRMLPFHKLNIDDFSALNWRCSPKVSRAIMRTASTSVERGIHAQEGPRAKRGIRLGRA